MSNRTPYGKDYTGSSSSNSSSIFVVVVSSSTTVVILWIIVANTAPYGKEYATAVVVVVSPKMAPEKKADVLHAPNL